ncbi:nuclear transport factor 2 family protein [Mucilaginibacter sp.]|uniref:nuclear transport factor 2 family protein n=1 Tax=Mucilaginibacter sp. TaxID=1882438 RepID=UPI0025D38E9F|nr:nuclear transport factor 2 family protein [Mucilaginibacter sp.]
MKSVNLKIFIATAGLMVLAAAYAKAQPPAGKYNTTNYPEDRKAIEALNTQQDNSQYLNDDYIAVGPEGKVSYGFEEWKKGFNDNNFTFKSVKLVPGTYILRIYNGDAAVKSLVADVVFSTPKGDVAITVIRTETYIKENGKWYFVSGQGTKKATDEEKEKLGTKVLEKN